MIVYHGTNQDIEEINLTKGNRYKDFGQGFYVTPNIATAQRMAEKKARFYGGEAMVIEYDFEESALFSDNLHTLVFPERATADWLRFVKMNRDRNKKKDSDVYDIVKGPIADDGVALQLDRLEEHVDQAETIAIDLQDKYLDQQIYFGTYEALKYLKKKSICKKR